MKQSRLVYENTFPVIADLGSDPFLIYDKSLEKKKNFKKWIAGFEHRYGVPSGEGLKALEALPRHIQNISKLSSSLSARSMTIVVLGGGSVGDFGGFAASIYKRGIRLVHVPSTWLAAIDSAHGGKTALNLGGIKNQVGTFYPAEKIYLIKEILLEQPKIRAHEAFAEIYKAALLTGGRFWRKFSECEPTSENLWKFLPDAIAAKYNIVKKDPFEASGHRHLLNFGHTMGHVFETIMQIPHGIAVNYGIRFALDWSQQKGLMSEKIKIEIDHKLASGFLLSPAVDGFLDKKYHAQIVKTLNGDKKKVQGGKIRFVFCQKPGSFRIENVSVEDILQESRRQLQI